MSMLECLRDGVGSRRGVDGRIGGVGSIAGIDGRTGAAGADGKSALPVEDLLSAGLKR